jgi:hypothetical protein
MVDSQHSSNNKKEKEEVEEDKGKFLTFFFLRAQLPSENDKEQNRLLSDAVTDRVSKTKTKKVRRKKREDSNECTFSSLFLGYRVSDCSSNRNSNVKLCARREGETSSHGKVPW